MILITFHKNIFKIKQPNISTKMENKYVNKY